MHVTLFTDGGSRGNPGPAASGYVIYDHDNENAVLVEEGVYLGEATNNQAEYKAIVFGLTKAKEIGATHVDVYMDTQLAERQLNGHYKVKDQKLAKLFLEVVNLKHSFKAVSFHHVPREENKAADAMVNKALDEELA